MHLHINVLQSRANVKCSKDLNILPILHEPYQMTGDPCHWMARQPPWHTRYNGTRYIYTPDHQVEGLNKP